MFQSLRAKGRGNRPKASDGFSDDDIDLFYEKGLLGESNPDTLLQTLHRNNMVYFGIRANTENRNLCWGDVELDADEKVRYLIYKTERITKTRPGENPRNVRQVLQDFYHSNT